MPSGQYTIDDTSRSRGDTSFRACVIALLIFLLFCVTIIIVLLVVRKDAGPGSAAGSVHDSKASKLSGDEAEKSDRRGVEGESEGTTSAASPSTLKPTAPVGNITSTSTEHPRRTTTDGSDSEVHRIHVLGNLTNTSTESPASASIVPSALPELRRSPEDSMVTTVTASTELPSSTAVPPILPTLPPLSVKPVPCESVECKKLATNILGTMGLDADPCKQFYEYACGGLRENKYMLEPDYEDEAWQRINVMVDKIDASNPESYRKFKTFIQSCKAYDPVKNINMWKEAVHKEMMELGDIAIEDTEFSKNFTRLFLGLLQHDRPFIFEVTLDINDTAPSKFAVKIFPAQMAENQLYPEDNGALECQAKAATKYAHLNNIYNETLNCMKNDIGKTKALDAAKEALLTLGIFSASDEADKLNKTLHDYVEFLDLNTKALGERAARRLQLQNRDPDTKTVKELNEMFETGLMVDWSAIIEKLLGRELKEDESVQLYSARYFKEIDNKFNLKQRQLHNALLVAFAAARYRDLVAVQRWRPHVYPSTHCTRLAARLLPDVATALYLHSFSDGLRSQLEQEAGNFVFEITNTFLKELDRAPWLNEDATETLKKDLEYKMEWIKDTRNVTGNMRDVMDTGKLDAALNDYTIDEAGFIKNAIMLMARNRKRLYKRIEEEPINTIWTHFLAPYDITGVSLYSLNFIAIPLGAVQKPFYDSEYLRHIRMAGLGFAVAHEMVHHIDPLGITFNTTINEETIKNYKDRIPGFSIWKRDVNIEYMNLTGKNKYKNIPFEFSDTETMLKHNEVFADKIAIQLAYKTYKKKEKKSNETLPYLPLTNDQSFFVFLAQRFCTKVDYFSMVLDFFESIDFPPETRVKNMIEGNAAFYNAFNCNVTDKTDFPFPYIEVPEDELDES